MYYRKCGKDIFLSSKFIELLAIKLNLILLLRCVILSAYIGSKNRFVTHCHTVSERGFRLSTRLPTFSACRIGMGRTRKRSPLQHVQCMANMAKIHGLEEPHVQLQWSAQR